MPDIALRSLRNAVVNETFLVLRVYSLVVEADDNKEKNKMSKITWDSAMNKIKECAKVLRKAVLYSMISEALKKWHLLCIRG